MRHPDDRDLALWAGGDLAPSEAARVEAHLADCPACRDLADDLRASREGLAALGAEPVDPAALVRIRARIRDGVRRRLEEEESRRPFWPWALAAVLALAALGVGIWYQGARTEGPERMARSRETPTPLETGPEAVPPTTEETPEAAPAPPPEDVPARPARRPPAPAREAPADPAPPPDAPAPPGPAEEAPVRQAALPPEPQGPTEPVVIKVVSDDPDIVYYWLVEPEETEDEAVSS